MRSLRIAVCGAATADQSVLELAYQVGAGLARNEAIVLTGGGGGVMAAASRGAKSQGGTTVGIHPTAEGNTPRDDSHIDLPIYTGMGQARNMVLVLSAQAVIAVGGEWGTLSEIALARKHQRPVVGLSTWRLTPPEGAAIDGITTADSAEQAVEFAIERAGRVNNE